MVSIIIQRTKPWYDTSNDSIPIRFGIDTMKYSTPTKKSSSEPQQLKNPPSTGSGKTKQSHTSANETNSPPKEKGKSPKHKSSPHAIATIESPDEFDSGNETEPPRSKKFNIAAHAKKVNPRQPSRTYQLSAGDFARKISDCLDDKPEFRAEVTFESPTCLGKDGKKTAKVNVEAVSANKSGSPTGSNKSSPTDSNGEGSTAKTSPEITPPDNKTATSPKTPTKSRIPDTGVEIPSPTGTVEITVNDTYADYDEDEKHSHKVSFPIALDSKFRIPTLDDNRESLMYSAMDLLARYDNHFQRTEHLNKLLRLAKEDKEKEIEDLSFQIKVRDEEKKMFKRDLEHWKGQFEGVKIRLLELEKEREEESAGKIRELRAELDDARGKLKACERECSGLRGGEESFG